MKCTGNKTLDEILFACLSRAVTVFSTASLKYQRNTGSCFLDIFVMPHGVYLSPENPVNHDLLRQLWEGNSLSADNIFTNAEVTASPVLRAQPQRFKVGTTTPSLAWFVSLIHAFCSLCCPSSCKFLSLAYVTPFKPGPACTNRLHRPWR